MKSRQIGLIVLQVGSAIFLLVSGLLMASAASAAVQPATSDPAHPADVRPLPASGQGSRATATAQASIFPSPVSDDFNTCNLDHGLWSFVNPLADSSYALTGTGTTDAWLEISVPAGVRHTLTGGNTNAPRMMQSIDNGDFEVEVKFESGVSQAFQIQGLLLDETPDSRFLRFDFYGSTSATRIYAASVTAPTTTAKIDTSINISETTPLYMRVVRAGDTYTQSYSFDGSAWITAGTFTDSLTTTAIGIFAGNSGVNPAHTAQIDYFFNSASEINPEDAGTLDVMTGVVGSGSVSKNPDLPTYNCGQSVALTALPVPGWSFDSWSGDATGNANPINITVNSSQAITATFTENQYTLGTSVVGNGAITKEPNQPTYLYGEVVTLTAVPDPGWLFENWSGDAGGTANPITITMTEDRAVTASFSQLTYTLSTNSTGSGLISIDPDQSEYTFGQVVTLTATADPFWTFDSWSGDLMGSVNPSALTITDNKVVTATFVSVPPAANVYLPMVRKADSVVQAIMPAHTKHLARTAGDLTALWKPQKLLAWLLPGRLPQ